MKNLIKNRISSDEAMSGTVEMIVGLSIVVVVATVVFTGLGRKTNEKATEVNKKIEKTDLDLKKDLEQKNPAGSTKNY